MNEPSLPSPARILVVGTGHPRQGDDGLGWHAARMLARSFPEDVVHLLVDDRLRPELAQELVGCSLVVFVRARKGKRPGTIRCERVEAGEGPSPADAGDLSPSQILLLARETFRAEPEAWSVTVAGVLWGQGEELSPIVRVALPELQARVGALVAGRRDVPA